MPSESTSKEGSLKPISPVVWLLLYLSFSAPIFYLSKTRPPGFQQWLTLISITQLFAGLILAHRTGMEWGLRFRKAGWITALSLLAAIQLLEWSLISHPIPSRLDLVVILPAFIRQLILIALVEEIWFRGLWLDACRNRPLFGAVFGAALFGFYHLAGGWSAVLLTFGIGLVFAAAKTRGVGIIALTVVHAAMNTLNQTIWPGVAWRLPSAAGPLVFWVGTALIAWKIYKVKFSK